MLEAIVQVKKSVASGPDQMKFSDDDLSDCKVKSRPCIQEEAIDGAVVVLDGVVDSFGEKECTKFMTRVNTKKLGFWLSLRPVTEGELSNIEVEGFGN